MTRLPRWALACAATAAIVLLTPWLVLAGVDAGLFDGAIQGLASAKAQRPVRFSRLQAHLLSQNPSITVENLSIGSPAAVSREPVLRAPLVTARVRLAPLLVGRLEPEALVLDHPRIHLVRVRPGVSNYAFGRGGAAGFLATTRRLVITDGVVDLIDIQRRTTLAARVTQDATPGDPAPFALQGGGVIMGGAFTVAAQGAPLNGRPAGAPYPFAADLRDGATHVVISGTSDRPFYFGTLDLAVRASGPNFADVGYIFGVATPNSAPFELTAHLRRAGPRLQVSNILARAGRSDLRGEITSIRRPDQPTLLQARLAAGSLFGSDIQAVVAPRPPHQAARVASGAPTRRPKSDGGLSAEPFPSQGEAKLDLQIDLTAARVPDAPLPIADLAAHVAWSGHRLVIAPARFETLHGRAQVAARLDLSRQTPTFAAKGSLRAARLGALRNSGADGDLDVFFNLAGQGRSPRAMAADTSGRLAFRVGHGRLQAVKAAALSGDLVQAVLRSTIGDKARQTTLDCAVGEFAASGGRLRATRLELVTTDGWTSGAGDIDIPDERLSLVLKGTPASGKGPHIGVPLAVSGPLGHPAVRPDPGAEAAPRRGLGGVLGAVTRSVAGLVSPTPPPAGPSCGALLPEAGRFVGE